MKLNYKISMLGLALFMFSFTACKQDFLEKSPLIGTTDENFYQTEEDAIAAVNAAYSTLQYELTAAGHFRWFWGDIMSDDSEKGGSSINDVFDLHLLETFQGPSNTDLLKAEWEANYIGINRSNLVLEKVPDIEMDADIKDRILAEAKFIRAWFYYNLATVFGDVPLVDHVLAPSEYNMPRNPISEVWNLIETDLNEAILDLPYRSEYLLSDLGRITKGTAQGLLVKTYAYQRKWSDAQGVAEDLIESQEYTLEPEFSKIFTGAGENGPGSIFEIQYMNASGGNWGYNNANEGTFTNVFTRARGDFGGFGFNIPTEDLVQEFFVEGFEDPRLSATVFREGEEMGDRGTFTKENAGGFPYDYYSKKTFNNKSEEAPFGDANPNGGTNDRVIRLADILLLHAEAAYHNGQEDAAKTSLNLVRARVGLNDVNDSGTDLLDAIYHERRVELALEGHRFFDLVRSERANSTLGALGFQSGVHEVFPIPDSQIQATNGAITQNPGY